MLTKQIVLQLFKHENIKLHYTTNPKKKMHVFMDLSRKRFERIELLRNVLLSLKNFTTLYICFS